ncbi:MAG: GNAT family N-acetyltransferase [Saprospiraceae bacterium]|nr:GNAT family N-acetyltransferase [Saprospiraceae bacterium]MCF8251427.1 GNAT family N-acetyltransferase [Saprospiraceae bacterium]MCF8312701.1 GNAT family N-acetyltransferase [Saprospiraceae bacterium]MCF8441033.1 GNAT family N-acetyltransferase [Saprospiraceae bacterium]
MNKNLYIDLGGILESPIYYHPWWLDIVCAKGGWDVCLHLSKEGKILGVLPYFLTNILGVKVIRTPPFTPTLGVWLDYSNCSDRNVSRYGFEMEAIAILVEQLPKVGSYHQIHPVQFENWYPFYWRGYQQTTRFTYIFEVMDLNRIKNGMKENVRNKIRKAEKLGLTVNRENNLEKLILLLKKTFNRQKLSFELDISILLPLHEAIQYRNQGLIYFIEDSNYNLHAAMYLIWDDCTAYCWLSGSDELYRNSGAMQLLIWHAINDVACMGKKFNFEGSMLPHIEPVFRAFGAERKPILQLRKFGNPLVKLIWWLLKG